jgi:hypothetical protein
MPEVAFAPFAEDFIEAVGTFLSKFELSLKQRKEFAANQSRIYDAEAPDGPVTIVFHQTAHSMGKPHPEYRARVIAETTPEFAEFARDKEDLVNRVATLGAMLASENAVLSQCLIPNRFAETTAGLLAFAIAHGRRSLITANARAFGRQEDETTVERLSAWTDLDFEEIHYDHAHLGIGTIGRRGWKMDFLGGSSLTLDAVHNNPDWGGGLLCLLRVPKASVVKEGEPIGAWALNTWSNLVGETPTFGAWCTDGDDFVFVQFLPNFVRRLPWLTDLLIEWGIARSREIVHLVQCERDRLSSRTDP